MPTKIDEILDEYKSLHLGQVIDYDKMRLYSIVENSTALEGSTLTAIETQLLLDEGITAKGKPSGGDFLPGDATTDEQSSFK